MAEHYSEMLKAKTHALSSSADGLISINGEQVKISELSEILTSCYTFLSGEGRLCALDRCSSHDSSLFNSHNNESVEESLFSGACTPDKQPILTFPDARAQLTYTQYCRLINYLSQVPP